MISEQTNSTSTVRIDPTDYDFTQAFPPPDDAALHRAGRQGILDQKEDPALSDGAWLALQHQCWLHELCAYGERVAWLAYCLAQGLDAASGERPRTPAQWPVLQTTLRNELTRCEQQRADLLEDYACHFGAPAAQRFGAFALAQCRDLAPAQRSLF
jgi:hypothetical protein